MTCSLDIMPLETS